MSKYPEKTIGRDPEKASLVKKTSMIHGVTSRFVYMVLNGERENEAVFTTYMNLLEGSNDLFEKEKGNVQFN